LENNQLGVMSQSILFIQGLTPGKLLLSLKWFVLSLKLQDESEYRMSYSNKR
jgi:hypothetical protein